MYFFYLQIDLHGFTYFKTFFYPVGITLCRIGIFVFLCWFYSYLVQICSNVAEDIASYVKLCLLVPPGCLKVSSRKKSSDKDRKKSE